MSVINLAIFGLRMTSAGAKFFLIFYIAKYHNPTFLGSLALLGSTLAMVVQILGFELNLTNARYIHSNSLKLNIELLRNQFAFHFLTHVVISPFLVFFIFFYLNFDWLTSILFFLLITSEHFGLEIFRLYISFLKPNIGVVLLFFRTALWIPLYVVGIEFNFWKLTITGLIGTWFVFSFLALITAAILNRKYFSIAFKFPWSSFFKKTRYSLREALPYFATSLVAAITVNADKFLINHLAGPANLGVYFFFQSVTSLLTLVVSFTVGSYAGPRAIRTYSQHGFKNYLMERNSLEWQYLKTIFFTMLLLVVFIKPTLLYLHKEFYEQNIEIFYILLISCAILSMSDVRKLDLYLGRKDRLILVAYVLYSIILIGSQFFLYGMYGIVGSALAMLISAICFYCAIRYLSSVWIFSNTKTIDVNIL